MLSPLTSWYVSRAVPKQYPSVLAVRRVYPCTHLPTYHSLTAPQRRLSMADALRHPFFDDVDKVNVGTVPLEGMGSEVAEAQ